MSGVIFAEDLGVVAGQSFGEFVAAPAGADAVLLTRKYGAVTRLTLNRPRAINALNRKLLVQLREALQTALTDGTRLVWLDGAGERGFCGGGDIKEISASKDPAWFRTEYSVDALLAEYPLPVIGLQHGITMGGGIGLTGHLRYRIVTETSRLAMPEVKIGIMPDVGGNLLLARAPGRLGEYLAVTGAEMGAKDALELGFSDYFVASERIPLLFAALCVLFLADATKMDQQSRQKILDSAADQGLGSDFWAPTRRENGEMSESLAAALNFFSAVPPQGTAKVVEDGNLLGFAKWWESFLSDVPVGFAESPEAAAARVSEWVQQLLVRLQQDGSEQALLIAKTIGAACPRSVLVSFAQVLRTRGLDLSLREVLDDDFRVLLRLGKGSDFAEGVRAQVIDKDKNPRWQEQTVAEVKARDVAEILAPYSDGEPQLWHS